MGAVHGSTGSIVKTTDNDDAGQHNTRCRLLASPTARWNGRLAYLHTAVAWVLEGTTTTRGALDSTRDLNPADARSHREVSMDECANTLGLSIQGATNGTREGTNELCIAATVGVSLVAVAVVVDFAYFVNGVNRLATTMARATPVAMDREAANCFRRRLKRLGGGVEREVGPQLVAT